MGGQRSFTSKFIVRTNDRQAETRDSLLYLDYHDGGNKFKEAK